MQRENAVAPPTRRLAAILCADLCSYSKAMAEDEASTLRLLARYRSISETIVRQFGGRIANTAGDGLLIEFSSALDALQGALDIQARIALANEDVQPSRKGSFRIGFHIGEVSVRYGDLFGDAVNIAARLQAIAPAGRVCLSNVAYQFVSKLNGVLFEPYGIHETQKNCRILWRYF
ncbi:adenylate/guanylate cyclase domain-containing protein [Methylobacterium sp. P31]